MTKDECKAIVDDYLKRVMWDFQVNMWTIDLTYIQAPADESWTMQVHLNPAYHQARILIDPERHETAEEVRAALQHELLHVVLAPFEAYVALAKNLCGTSMPKLNALDGQAHISIEQVVWNLENLLKHGLRYNTDHITNRRHPEFKVNYDHD
jgi:hypothetical protein